MRNILFYKYAPLHNLNTLQQELYDLCSFLRLLGKIHLAEEGINGCLTGSKKDIQQFMDFMRADSRFADVQFKQGITGRHGFKKLFVRIRREIVTSGLQVNVMNHAPYLEPEQLKEWLDNGKDVVLVDARNQYESAIGRFRNAFTPNIKTFRQWPEAVKQLEKQKNKVVVTYCTGGIRCEKASAYLKENGFNNVYQLRGGILNYGKIAGSHHWEGKCFVFDKRGAIDLDEKNPKESISQCVLCFLPCDSYHNCAIPSCDKLFLACSQCLGILEGCCSKRCRGKSRTVAKHYV